jgi:tetratricopeptide (TPR) repeat protein
MTSNAAVTDAASRKTYARRLRWVVLVVLAIIVATAGVAFWRMAGSRSGSPERDWVAIEGAIGMKRWGEAESRLDRWLGRTPGDGKALLRLGAVFAVQGREDEAGSAFLRVAPSDPSWPQAQGRLGEYWLRKGNLREAERAFRNAARDRPRAVEPRRRLVYIFTVGQRNDEARVVLWDLYQLTHDTRHLVTMAGLSAAVPDARDPSPELDRFLLKTPDDPVLRRSQGLRLLALGRPADARPYLEAAAGSFVDDRAGRLALAECRILLGNTDGIADLLGSEPDRAADKVRWWLLTGQAAELSGRPNEAVRCWLSATSADPESRVAHYRLGQALARQGAAAEAKHHLDRAERIRLRQVSLILALDQYLRGGNGAEVTERLGSLCRDLGLLPEARGWYGETIRLEPGRREAQVAWASLTAVGGPPAPPLLLTRPVVVSRGPRRAGNSAPPTTHADAARLRFSNVAPRCGIDFRYDSGASGELFIGDTMGGGVALFDTDKDGWLDIYLVNGCALPVDKDHPPAPNKLYRNKGDGTFEDVTARAGVGGRGYGMGCAVGDYDNDGDDDLFVTGLMSTVLYRNKGDGTFEDVTAQAGVGSSRWTTAAAFADLDGDGDLDLVVAAYVGADPRRVVHCNDPVGHRIHCPPGQYPPEPDHLFRNNGDGTFTDVARESGLDPGVGPGLGLAVADFDGDDRLDLFVANDATPNFLDRNLGGLRFEETGAASGAAYDGNGRATASMGVVADDLDGDGLIDLLHTNFVNESVTFLKNLGGGQFADATDLSGLTAPTREVTGFGAVGFDADNDGDIDLFFANGHVDDRPWDGRLMAQRPQLFVNRGRGRFEPAPGASGYFGSTVVGRGAAAGDLDNDGRVDLVVVHRDAPAAVLMNRTEAGHWLGIRLRGTKSGRTPVGARVTYRAGGQVVTRWLSTGTSYLASGDQRVWLGLGPATAVEHLQVRWPSGLIQSWRDLPADRLLDLEEGHDPSTTAPPRGSADPTKR